MTDGLISRKKLIKTIDDIPKVEGQGHQMLVSVDDLFKVLKETPDVHLGDKHAYAMLLHKTIDLPIDECIKAHEVAVAYLRNHWHVDAKDIIAFIYAYP